MHDLQVILFPQLSDNYAYILQCTATGEVALVDCPDAEPMIQECERRGWTPTKVLNTHHHWDHINGNEDLLKKWPELQIYGFSGDQHRIPTMTHPVEIGDSVSVGQMQARVMASFGHTSGHIAYYFADAHAVFCGDTMFAAGCGRLFEGTAEDMHASLQALGALPSETRVYCGHEYTASNLRFALSVDPENTDLHERTKAVQKLREEGLPTLPTTIADEWKTNPFLRVDAPAIRAAAQQAGADLNQPASIMGAIRKLKDSF